MTYFGLTFALSLPFWMAGALTHFQLLPGVPVSTLGLLFMVGAASILVYRENGLEGVRELWKRAFDFKRVKAKIWYLPTILLMPAMMVLSFVVLRLMDVPVPNPQFSFATSFTLFAVFFIAAIGEELDWSGYAIDPLQERYGALGGALLFGVVWRLALHPAALGAAFSGLDRYGAQRLYSSPLPCPVQSYLAVLPD